MSYVDHNRHLDFVATFSDTLNIVEDGEDIASLDTVIRRQYRNGEYGSELFILAAAQKLDNYTFFLWAEEKSDPNYQFSIFAKFPTVNGIFCPFFGVAPYILLANCESQFLYNTACLSVTLPYTC